jgi:DNA-directed RNA polymerase subunit beta'
MATEGMTVSAEDVQQALTEALNASMSSPDAE